MSAEENKALVRRFYEQFWNKGDLVSIDELLAPDFVDHNPQALAPGREGAKQLLTTYRAALPDLQITVDDLIAEGDKVVARYTARGTQRGDMPGIPATGKHATVTGIDILRVAGNQIAEHWGEADQLGMMQQLGVIPMPEPAAR